MKGVLFNVVEEVITAEFGADAWDDLLHRAELDGAYTALGSYPDSDMTGLVVAASEKLGVAVSDVLMLVGRKAFDGLAARYPGSLDGATTAAVFLEDVENYIHPEVRKLYPDAVLPEFTFADLGEGWMRMGYRSPRGLDYLAEGLVHGAADHFGETVEVRRPDVESRPNETILHLSFSGGHPSTIGQRVGLEAAPS